MTTRRLDLHFFLGANIARRLIVASIVAEAPVQLLRKTAKKLNVSVNTLRKSIMDLKKIETLNFVKSMSKERTRYVLTDETKAKVRSYYNEIARTSPNKKDTVLVDGIRTAIKYLEQPLSTCYNNFKKDFTLTKIGQTSFEQLRPKNIKLSLAKRQVCCCITHVNIESLRVKLNGVLKANESITFENNEDLVQFTLCNSDRIQCIEQKCKACGPCKFDALSDKIIYCSEGCKQVENDCSYHTVTANIFKYELYTNHKNESKKKLALVTEQFTLNELIAKLKKLFLDFPRHRYNNYHTKEVFSEVKKSLKSEQILKVQDYSENYTCLVPVEVQTLHWSQIQATLYPVVVYRRDELDNVIEEQLIFLSPDIKHDCVFVEYANSIIHQYYQSRGISINHDIEFNDGASSQFKSIKSFWLFASRSITTDRIYFESGHGKGPSDGIGGVIKAILSNAVSGEKKILRNAKEVFDYLVSNCTINERDYSEGHICARRFFYIDDSEIKQYREKLGDVPFKTYDGTRKLHHVRTPNDQKKLLVRNYSCLCDQCINGNYKNCCEKLFFKKYAKVTQLYLDENRNEVDNDIETDEDIDVENMDEDTEDEDTEGEAEEEEGYEDQEDPDEDEIPNEIDEVDTWKTSEAVGAIRGGDIVVVRSGDSFNPYYLLCALNEVEVLESDANDDYGHFHLKGCSVIKGHYLEEMQRRCNSVLYYKDERKVAIVSVFSVAGISPQLIESVGMKRRKQVSTYKVMECIHNVLTGLITGCNV